MDDTPSISLQGLVFLETSPPIPSVSRLLAHFFSTQAGSESPSPPRNQAGQSRVPSSWSLAGGSLGSSVLTQASDRLCRTGALFRPNAPLSMPAPPPITVLLGWCYKDTLSRAESLHHSLNPFAFHSCCPLLSVISLSRILPFRGRADFLFLKNLLQSSSGHTLPQPSSDFFTAPITFRSSLSSWGSLWEERDIGSIIANASSV